MSDSFYLKPIATTESLYEIKKSRFYVSITPLSTVVAARACIQQAKATTPSANHHCSAFITSTPHAEDGFGYSDDGEPSGTAGKPMFNVLQGNNVGEACVIVTRFFGGIKLGTGGLVRAYSTSVKEAITQAKFEEVHPRVTVELTYPYTLSSTVDTILHSFDTQIIDSQYAESVTLKISITATVVNELTQQVQERGRGLLLIEML
ncbi:YigZ family protein [Neptunomonas sp.]|uniref:YigZ family protein n=1 Tax=Neptunomonas sp. TaxID=1971898 RepID=UPI0025DE4A30|nr:YigZ family protein [Neptunomonas sp.]